MAFIGFSLCYSKVCFKVADKHEFSSTGVTFIRLVFFMFLKWSFKKDNLRGCLTKRRTFVKFVTIMFFRMVIQIHRV